MNLELNRHYFERSLKYADLLFKNNENEECVKYISHISKYAWSNFTGYYSNWKLEGLLNHIGDELPKLATYERVRNGKVLHIASELYVTGGHTKLLFNWIKNDTTKQHSVVTTRLNTTQLELIANEYSVHCELFELNGCNLLEKSFDLKKVAHNFEFIILHTHPDDVIPVLAFSDKKFKTPIIFNNHADHIFWLGNSIIDVLIQIRNVNIELDKKRRQLFNSFYLPIIIEQNNGVFKSLITKNDNINILSTGSQYKYKPNEQHNFFESLISIVNKYKTVHAYLAGVSENYEFALKFKHDRIHYLGTINNLDYYENIADIYLEGFPISSFTALIQPALKKKYIHLMYKPTDNMIIFDQKVEHALGYYNSLKDWLLELNKVIEYPDYRKEKQSKQYQYINSEFSIEKWKNQLELIYLYSNNTEHKINNREKDIFLSSIDERLIADSNLVIINHFNYLQKLNLYSKINLIFEYNRKYHLKKLTLKSLIRFLIPFSIQIYHIFKYKKRSNKNKELFIKS